MMRATIIVVCPLPESSIELLRTHFDVHYVPDAHRRAEVIDAYGAMVRGVVTNVATAWPVEWMDKMPRLEIIHMIGAGYETIDVAAAAARGITVTHGRGANVTSVADHAVALLMGIMRGLAANDRAIRDGQWDTLRHARPDFTGCRVGIFGLGAIGLAIASRLSAFDMHIAYHNRRQRTDVRYDYAQSVVDLARDADCLIVAAPGGDETRHRIDETVLNALGPMGYLVNVGRGSVVDTAALVSALHDGRIAGAALDVYEQAPPIAQSLLDAPNLLLSPHIAGFSPRSDAGYVSRVIDNLEARFAGRAVATPVPGSA